MQELVSIQIYTNNFYKKPQMPYMKNTKKNQIFLVVNIYEKFRLFTIRFTRVFFYKHSPKQNIKIKKFILIFNIFGHFLN